MDRCGGLAVGTQVVDDTPATPWRVRFAPSPTGALHFGALRTALFAWLIARHTKGTFLLRIEDTDQARHIEGSEDQIQESLRWLGLTWDEGPDIGGPVGPYVQSERRDLYTKWALTLVEQGAAYWCSCTSERLTQMRKEQEARHVPTRYDRHCLERQEEVAAQRAAGTPAVIRLRIPEGTVTWDDVVLGETRFNLADIDDQVLLKSDGFPTYHLACVVDDHLMGITHVIRSQEWVPSTPKHLVLYEAFGWEPPRFAHPPNVLGKDRRKLSKRHGAVNILTYRERGYLPAAITNAMALLGWSSGTEEEIFDLDALVERFTMERVMAAGSIFDEARLDAIQATHLRALSDDALDAQLAPWIPGADDTLRRSLIPLLRERIVRLADATAMCAPLTERIERSGDVEFPPANVPLSIAAALVQETMTAIEQGVIGATPLRERLSAFLSERFAGEKGAKPRDAFRVLYIAILGVTAGLPVFDVIELLGEEESLARLRAASTELTPSLA